MTRTSTIRLYAAGLMTMFATLALILAIPHDRFVRWQAMRTEAYARLGWVYERIHDDPTPIDVALIGTSHTMNGLDGLAIAQRIAAQGTRARDGRCLTVTNFAIPQYGRNLHWLIARELLGARKPKVLVIEVFENETRKAHPLFSYVADSRDVVTAPALFNLNYAGDLLRLPWRQVVAGAESLWPAQFGLKTRFDPADYDGSTVDNTHVVNVGGRALTRPLTHALAPADLERQVAELRKAKDLHMLPAALENYEYAVPRRYLSGILALADAAHVPVWFLYLPGYGQPPLPYDMRPYAGRPMLTLNDVLRRNDIWHDPAHLDAQGAAAASQRVADLLAQRLRVGGAAAGAAGQPCQFGYPARAVLKPFVAPGRPS